MLKTRIIAVLVVRQGIVVQSIGFARYLPVGVPAIAVEYLNRWGIDEIILVDIDATRRGRGPDHAMIERCAVECHVPLTCGGGIRTLEDIESLVRSGADKVAINAAAVLSPNLISQGAGLFGNQCIVVSIDARKIDDRRYEAFIHSGTQSTGKSPIDIAKMAEQMGAGEILLNSIDRDGSGRGYDPELIGQVMKAVKIPVIACGGVGHPGHLLEGMKLGVHAVAAANFFHYSEHSVITAKRVLQAAGMPVRLDSHADYAGADFDESGRIRKRPDEVLEKQRFEYIPEEVI